VVGLPTPLVAKELGSPVMAIIKFREEVRLIDDILAAQTRLGKQLGGVLINRVPLDAAEFVSQFAAPFIERQGISIFGVLPEQQNLAAFTVGELIDLLKPELLTKLVRKDAFVENLTVGAMTAETALSRFRKYSNKAVITGGDRSDILMAALETSTACLILTGNLRPSALVVKQAEEFGVPVLLVHSNTMETVEMIERTYGKTRLGNTAKLRQFQGLMDKHCHYDEIYTTLGLK
jgi:BioD-like phosphotransacetylase family protein